MVKSLITLTLSPHDMEQKELLSEEEEVKIKLAQALSTKIELLVEKSKLLVELERLTSEIEKMKEKMKITRGGS